MKTTRDRTRLWLGLTFAVVFIGLAAIIFTVSLRSPASGVKEVPARTLDRWGRFLIEVYAPDREDPSSPCVRRLQAVADSLTASLGVAPVDVYVATSDEINAVSLPPRRIVVYRGLLEDVASENELVMILGHEIGHHEAGHVGEAFRRRAALTLATSGIGRLPVLGDIIVELGNLNELHFSREAELEADITGLQLLQTYYGHAAGAADFFGRRLDDESDRSLEFLSTHPFALPRIEALDSEIRKQGWPVGETVPVPPACAP